MVNELLAESSGAVRNVKRPPYSNRVWFLEWLRVAACLAVVLIHALVTLLDNSTVAQVGSLRALAWTEVLVVFGRWAVPVFLMITGALLLDPQRAVGGRKLFGYIKRMMLVLAIFGTGYALMELVFDARTVRLSMLPMAVLNVLQGKNWAHMWYVYDLLGIYLLLPFLRAFVAQADRRLYGQALGVLFLFACVVSTVNAAVGLQIQNVLWLGSSVFYVLLGRYLFVYGRLDIRFVSAAVVCLIAQAILAAVGIVGFGAYWRFVWVPASPLVAACSACLFVFAKERFAAPMKPGGVAMTLSRLSFGIYLVHPVFANLLYKALHWGPALLPPVVYEVVTFALVLLPSALLAAGLRCLPVFRAVL